MVVLRPVAVVSWVVTRSVGVVGGFVGSVVFEFGAAAPSGGLAVDTWLLVLCASRPFGLVVEELVVEGW